MLQTPTNWKIVGTYMTSLRGNYPNFIELFSLHVFYTCIFIAFDEFLFIMYLFLN